MKTVTLSFPESVDIELRDIKFCLAAKLYETAKLSLGQAAELVGLSKRTFIELLGSYNTSVINYDVDELEQDFKNA